VGGKFHRLLFTRKKESAMRKDKDFEAQKEALMKEVRSVLQEVENLYDAGVESGTVEAKALKAKAQAQLGKVKSQFADFEAAASAKAHEAADRAREAAHYTAEKARGACRSTDELIQEKPYYAMALPHWPAWWSACCSTAVNHQVKAV
jgi:ElaB protein